MGQQGKNLNTGNKSTFTDIIYWLPNIGKTLQDTYTALILSKFVLGSELVLTSVTVAARGDGQCVCAFLQPILNISGLKSKFVKLIFSQVHIIMEPMQNMNM
jgi:hypothetical protein